MLQKKLDNPTILQLSPRENFVYPPINLCDFSTIFVYNRYFGQRIMAQAFNQHPIRLGSANLNNGNVIDSFNNSLVYSDPENDQILRWLSPLEPDTRHRETHTTRFEGVGDQLQETSEFREWRGGVGGADKAVLFCSGNPGAGKTYLR